MCKTLVVVLEEFRREKLDPPPRKNKKGKRTRREHNELCRDYYQRSQERIRAKRKEYRQRNLKKCRAQDRASSRRYCQNSQGAEKRKEWRQKNRDALNEKRRGQNRTNRDAINEKRRELLERITDVLYQKLKEYRQKKPRRHQREASRAKARVKTSSCRTNGSADDAVRLWTMSGVRGI